MFDARTAEEEAQNRAVARDAADRATDDRGCAVWVEESFTFGWRPWGVVGWPGVA